MEKKKSNDCPSCGNSTTLSFFEVSQVPVSIGVQWPKSNDALHCAKGDVVLMFCPECGFIWNGAFDEEKLSYSQAYDNSLDFSYVFRNYAEHLAERLIETYGIRGKSVIDIGCGKGNFLSLLCEEGNNWGVGFDPSYDGECIVSSAKKRLQLIADYYSEKYAGLQADLICCRHVFEHIAQPIEFLKMIRRAVGERLGTILYFEVPNVRLILRKLSVWDIIYEHCNYFGVESLGYVFEKCGFEVLKLEECYDGQFLGIEARPRNQDGGTEGPRLGDLEKLQDEVDAFSFKAEACVGDWQSKLQALDVAGEKAVVWGAGAKAVGFLNMLGIREQIPFAVDINPHKQGRFLPGTCQQIVSPGYLEEYKPGVVIIMNPIYEKEVAFKLAELGVEAGIVAA